MLNTDALHRVVAAELATALPDVDDALPQYVVALVADGGDAAGVADALSEFLEERSVEFAEWLFSHLAQNAQAYGWTGGSDANTQLPPAAPPSPDRRRGRGASPSASRAASRSRSRERQKAGAGCEAGRGRAAVRGRAGARGRGSVIHAPPPASSSVFDRLGPRVGGGGRGGPAAHAPPAPAAAIPPPPPSNRVVVVKNVHFDATPAELTALLTAAGATITSVSIARAATGAPKGFALVECATPDAARAALSVAGKELRGRAVDVVLDRRSEAGGVVAPPAAGRGRGRGGGRGAPGRGRGAFGGRTTPSSHLTYVCPETRKAELNAELDALRSAAVAKKAAE